MDPASRSAADGQLSVIRPLVLTALFLGAALPASAQPRRGTFTCTAEASGGGLEARTRRLLDLRGELRGGETKVDIPLPDGAGLLRASWDVENGLPQVALGRYQFELAPAADAEWQLARPGKPLRAKAGILALSGKDFSALLSGGTPIELILAGRDGQERARRTLDTAAFAAALDLARQADARALAQSADPRGHCTRGN